MRSRALVERQVSYAHVVKASEEDLEWLYPGRALEDCARGVGDARSAILRRDAWRARRARLARQASAIDVPAPHVDVVDTVGAGDSFMSALLSAMDRDGALGAEAPAPDAAALERWLAFAAAASAITCTRKGSDPPTRADVEALLRS